MLYSLSYLNFFKKKINQASAFPGRDPTVSGTATHHGWVGARERAEKTPTRCQAGLLQPFPEALEGQMGEGGCRAPCESRGRVPGNVGRTAGEGRTVCWG